MSTWQEDPIAEVRRLADIVEVISEAVVLKRSGRNYVGLCPFHGEKTPSFNVNPERQIFRCFGCGEGGDVFSFVMKSGHLTFPEALQTLADRYGVTLPDRRPENDERGELREANEIAMNFYMHMLRESPEGEAARTYLAARGLSPEMQIKFQLGYAPAQWDALHRHLNQKKIPQQIQLGAALVRARNSGEGHYDYFRNRVIFPIHNEASQVVGFGGRAIAEGDEPKYLNSPETPLYHKGHLLFGLHQARESIKARDEALLMEGYLDVITAHAHGFTQAVGVLGTALTPQQARVLLRYTPGKRVVLAFDADRAGQQAAERGITTLLDVTQGLSLSARVLAVPAGKDPDAYLRQEGTEAFEKLLKDAPGLVTYLLGRAIARADTTTREGRSQAVVACVPVLRQIENYVTRSHHVEWISERLGVREDAIRLEIGKGMRHNVTPSRPGQITVKKLSAREAEQILLFAMVAQPSVIPLVNQALGAIPFEPVHETIRSTLSNSEDTGLQLSWDGLLDKFAGREDVQKVVSAIMFAEYNRWDTELSRLVSDCIDTLLRHYWEAELLALKQRLKLEGEQLAPEANEILVRRLKDLSDYCVHLKHKRSNLLAPDQQGNEEKRGEGEC